MQYTLEIISEYCRLKFCLCLGSFRERTPEDLRLKVSRKRHNSPGSESDSSPERELKGPAMPFLPRCIEMVLSVAEMCHLKLMHKAIWLSIIYTVTSQIKTTYGTH